MNIPETCDRFRLNEILKKYRIMLSVCIHHKKDNEPQNVTVIASGDNIKFMKANLELFWDEYHLVIETKGPHEMIVLYDVADVHNIYPGGLKNVDKDVICDSIINNLVELMEDNINITNNIKKAV